MSASPEITHRIELLERLEGLARVPVLLIASDYDGTLSPIVPDPTQALPDREAMVALKALAAMPHTHVAVISGRSLSDLARLTGSPDDVHLVGSHGSEFDPGFSAALPPGAVELRDRILGELTEIALRGTGFTIERKPASIAFHYRNADGADVDGVLEAILAGPGSYNGVYARRGKKVLELAVVATDKGRALKTLRNTVGASAAVFIGDDQTDEDAFSTLSGPDLGVKVGDGPTRAAFRVTDPSDVARLLAILAELRSSWFRGSHAVPIQAHSMLSDQRTIALVTPDARVTWMCAPRIDAPALFAELLGGPSTGYFSIRAADDSSPIEQYYIDDTMQLVTRWEHFMVTDYLDCSGGRPMQRSGRTELIRTVEGSGDIVVEFAPRLDFGRAETRLTVRDGGLEVEPSADPIVLRSQGVAWQIEVEGIHHTARAEIELGDEPVVLEFRYGTGNLRPPIIPEPERRRQTARFWSGWAERLTVPDVAPALVRRSALVLKGLCYGPRGGIAAAGTTSLPEHLGGVRNWDYRFCWLRDAAMSARALVKLGSTTEAMHYLDWVLGVLDDSPGPERLRPLYTVQGHHLGPEAELAELVGYAGSRPVRVGNAAAQQVQLDVFGPIVALIRSLLAHGAPVSSEHWRIVEAMVTAVEKRWTEPDHGIWEIRGPRRHHVHSKIMCWVTVDRAVTIADQLLGRERTDWMELRARIAADIFENGWKPEVHAFTAAYDGVDLDAAVLEAGLCGLLEPDDPRFRATVEAVEHALRHGPIVYRYRGDDGLPGTEGGFLLSTSWLIDSYLLIGRTEDAWALFDDLVGLAGPTGMLAEEYDPESDRALGNHPQAYSHLGLIYNALNLAKSGPRP